MSTREQLNTRAESDFPDNQNKLISPKKLREYVIEQNDSMANLEDEMANLSGGVVKNYSSNRTYLAGDSVMVSGSLFEANVDINPAETFNPSKWTQRTGVSTPSDYDFVPWNSATPYIVGDRVSDSNKLYVSIQVGTNKKPSLNPSFWTEVSANDGLFGNQWTEGFYLQNQVVTYENYLYYLDVDTSEDPFSSESFEVELDNQQWKLFHKFLTEEDIIKNYKLVATTTTNSVTELLTESGDRIIIPDNSNINFNIKFNGFQTAGTAGTIGESINREYQGTIINLSGELSIVGTITEITYNESDESDEWLANITADNINNSLNISVTGELSKTINWKALVIINDLI